MSTIDIAQLRNFLNALSFPFMMSNIKITEVNITTVCRLNNATYQCRCEDQYFWPCDKCIQYGSCDVITNTSCGCINGIPNDGQFCQPRNELNSTFPCPLQNPTEYLIEIEIDLVERTDLLLLEDFLNFPFMMSTIKITEVNITTVCLLNNATYQCRCEDQYFWPCDKCIQYGSCDVITNTSCGCINGIPNDGQFCKPRNELNSTLSCPIQNPTDYLIEIEIYLKERSDLLLREFLNALSFPFMMNNINITEVNITTVCHLNNSTYQCRCEEQYFWPCDKCTQYGSCDVITNTSCGCINGIPNDGQFCQPINELNNFTACPLPTATTTEDTTTPITNSTSTTTSSTTTEDINTPSPNTTIPTTTTHNTTTENTTTSSTTTSSTTTDDTTTPITNTTSTTTLNTTIPITTTTTATTTTESTTTTTPTADSTTTTTTTTESTTTTTPTADSTTTATTTTESTTTATESTTTPTTTTESTTTATESTTTPTTTAESTTTTATESTTTATTTAESTTTATESTTTATTTAESTTTTATESTTTATTTAESTTTATESTTTTTTTTESTTTATTTTESTTTATESTTTTTTTTESTTTTPTTESTTTATTTTPSTTTATTTTPSTTTATTTTESTTTATTTTPSTTTATTTTESTRTATSTTPSTTTATTESTTTTTRTPGTTLATTTTTTPATNIGYSLTLNEVFDSALTDSKSEKYKQYQKTFEEKIELNYKSVPGYQPNSVKVTGFRLGSVIVDYIIKATTTNLDLSSANQQLATSLTQAGYKLASDPFSRTVEGGLYPDNSIIFPEQDLILTCNTSANDGIVWTKDGNNLQSSDHYIINGKKLTVKNPSPNDNGRYSCKSTENSESYTIWQKLTIQPYPVIQASGDRALKCVDTTVRIYCCVQESYTVQWITGLCPNSGPTSGCIYCSFTISEAACRNTDLSMSATCQVASWSLQKSINIKTTKTYTCLNGKFGVGNQGDRSQGECDDGMVGYQVAKCTSEGWRVIEDNCILGVIQNLKDQAQTLDSEGLTQFVTHLSSATSSNSPNITSSPETIVAIIDLLKVIVSVSQKITVDKDIMTGFLNTLDVIGSNEAQQTWQDLNNDKTSNASSDLLNSIENMGQRLTNQSLNIITNSTQLIRANSTESYFGQLGKNSTTNISVTDIKSETFITIIVFSDLDNVLPVRTQTYNDSSANDTKINGDVVVVQTNPKVNNLSLSYVIKDKSLGNPQCVYWNFNLLNGTGGWDSTGCKPKLINQNKSITCECNHTTSFSILMSPFTLTFEETLILSYITHIGVGISMGSLVLCLIIEIIVWKAVTRNETSYMRHVSIVNIALSLLIADIWFIIGAAVQNGLPASASPCSAATFFTHFFYLALFFWMLLSALLLLYRTIVVFSRMSRAKMMAIAFSIGYGAPLLIAVITVASTAGNKEYIQENNCWLNWDKTKAMLAFVIPALTIVVINLLVLIVVLWKMLRRGAMTSTQQQEKQILLVILKCVGVLTPLFGLTWGFGIGTMVSKDFGIHVVFAFLNSLQGFLILVFGSLLDYKVRETLIGRFSLRSFSSSRTRSTSAGPSSSSGGLPVFWRLRPRTVYNVSENHISSGFTSSSANSDTLINA